MPSELPAERMVLLTFRMGVPLLASCSPLPDDLQIVSSTYIWRLTDTCNSSSMRSDTHFGLTKAPAKYGIYAYIQAYAHSHKRISKTFFKKNVCTYKMKNNELDIRNSFEQTIIRTQSSMVITKKKRMQKNKPQTIWHNNNITEACIGVTSKWH